jgi:hypothetical protein
MVVGGKHVESVGYSTRTLTSQSLIRKGTGGLVQATSGAGEIGSFFSGSLLFTQQ